MTARFARARSVVQARTWTVEQGGRLLETVDRLVPLARRVATGVGILAGSGAAAAIVILGSVVVIERPYAWIHILVLAILAGFLLLPAALLWMFRGALLELVALPGWLRSSPDLFKNHGAEVVAFVADLHNDGLGEPAPGAPAPISRRRRGFPRDVVRAGRLALQAHGDLPEYGSLLRLASVPFLIAVAASFVAIALEWLLAAVLAFAAMLVMLL